MSSTIFFHSPQELNWKLWGMACLAATLTAAISFHSIQEQSSAFLNAMSIQGVNAEHIGHYRQARQDFDLALLKARASNDKKLLITALINSARIDNEFDEEKLATSLASEAVQLSSQIYGAKSPFTAEAKLALAECLSDDDKALALYSEALQIFKNVNDSDMRYSAQIAKCLLEMSICYDALGNPNNAISACKASLQWYKHLPSDEDIDYSRALLQYATIMDFPVNERLALLNEGLRKAEAAGKNHPAVATTLSIMAANEVDPSKKEELLRRAVQIDEEAFGSSSTRVARDLMGLSDVLKQNGQKKAAQQLQERAGKIFQEKSRMLEELSSDFLSSYSKLLHELQFNKEAGNIDAIVKRRADTPVKLAFKDNSAALETEDESESNPEYWQRTEELPIDGVEKFSTSVYDHIKVWYDKGVLKLNAYSEGKIVWQKEFAQCATGIVNLSADKDKLYVNWRDGDGPVWHNDVYQINREQIKKVSQQISDAYAQQIGQQLDDILEGDSEALLNGAVESVPATYININFIAGAIRKGEHKALDIYGQGDAAAAAERLGMVFDLTAKAIDAQRSETNLALSRTETWLDAWKFMQLPAADYIGPLNDYGFFLQQSGCLKESISVFKLVTSVAPERAVAYLNLADSCWDIDKRVDAQKYYLCYLLLIKETHNVAKVPARVWQRIAVKLRNGGATDSGSIKHGIPDSSGKSPVLRLSLPGV